MEEKLESERGTDRLIENTLFCEMDCVITFLPCCVSCFLARAGSSINLSLQDLLRQGEGGDRSIIGGRGMTALECCGRRSLL